MNEDHINLIEETISEIQECKTPKWISKKIDREADMRIKLLFEIRDFIRLSMSLKDIKK